MDKPNRVILDTSVLLDNYLPGRNGAQSSSRVLSLAERLNVTLFYTAAQASDLFCLSAAALKALVRKEKGTLSPSDTAAIDEGCWEILENLSRLATVVAADDRDVWIARTYRSLNSDVASNLVVAAAERAKVDFLVTNDETLLKHAPVATISPEGLVALLEAYDKD